VNLTPGSDFFSPGHYHLAGKDLSQRPFLGQGNDIVDEGHKKISFVG
jgi:hypothetical protein